MWRGVVVERGSCGDGYLWRGVVVERGICGEG